MLESYHYVDALWEVLSDRYLFPRERLRRGLKLFDSARLYEAGWPISLRILAERIGMDLAASSLVGCALGQREVEGLLSKLTQFALTFRQAGSGGVAETAPPRRKRV